GNGGNPGFDRDGAANEPIRNTTAVISLVMPSHDVERHRHILEQRRQDAPADRGMRHDVLVLFRTQWPRLVQHRLAHADLSDVVYASADLDLLDGFWTQSDDPPDCRGIAADAQRVPVRVRVLHFE